MDIGNPRVMELIHRRNLLLLEHPELESLQDKIEDSLKRAGNQNNRLVTITKLMKEQFHILSTHTGELLTSLQTLLSDIKEFDKID